MKRKPFDKDYERSIQPGESGAEFLKRMGFKLIPGKHPEPKPLKQGEYRGHSWFARKSGAGYDLALDFRDAHTGGGGKVKTHITQKQLNELIAGKIKASDIYTRLTHKPEPKKPKIWEERRREDGVIWKDFYIRKPKTVSLEHVQKVEAQMGVTLPSDFVEFARHHHGQMPDPNWTPIDDRQGTASFNGLYHFDLEIEQGFIGRKFFDGLIPISNDAGGNFMGYDYVADPSNPPIVFWDHETDKTHKIADSFTELLDLFGLPDDRPPRRTREDGIHWRPYFYSSPEGVSDKRIQEVEDVIGAKLPADFIVFAKKYDGHKADPCSVPVDGYEDLELGALFPFEKARPGFKMVTFGTPDFVPFAADGPYFFGFDYVANPENPPVVLWDDMEKKVVARICGSFTELLDLLGT